jgi:hypothetical protein
MPGKLPYELAKVLTDIERFERTNDRVAGIAWRLEVLRILGRKRSDSTNQQLKPEDIGLDLPSSEDARVGSVRKALADWVQAALVAHAVADARHNVDQVTARGNALEKRHDHY